MNKEGCRYCDIPIYLLVEQLNRPLLAPATEVESLEYKLVDKTGLKYLPFKKIYCPVCGRKLGE